MSAKGQDRITLDPAICQGEPCIRGLRYPVEGLLELQAAGMSFEAILAAYEDLEREDILAALEDGRFVEVGRSSLAPRPRPSPA